ncbi:transposable element Tcb2 transposase [Trichonephila clavipes]|nr:transposable element Tcb2 transposase [Trichonephila clavipes]
MRADCNSVDTLLKSVVARLWIRSKETGNVRHRPGAGRPLATTSTDDWYIQLTARRNRTVMLRSCKDSCSWQHDEGCPAKQYDERRLHARRPMVCIPLTPHHRAARRRWTAEHRDWEQHDWSQVLFTNESRFSLECDTRRVLVWRDRGTRKTPHSFKKGHNTAELVGWYGWNQHRRTYGPAYQTL